MWEPERLTTLGASTASYRDSFAFLFLLLFLFIIAQFFFLRLFTLHLIFLFHYFSVLPLLFPFFPSPSLPIRILLFLFVNLASPACSVC
jgi:hypothetical protein